MTSRPVHVTLVFDLTAEPSPDGFDHEAIAAVIEALIQDHGAAHFIDTVEEEAPDLTPPLDA